LKIDDLLTKTGKKIFVDISISKVSDNRFQMILHDNTHIYKLNQKLQKSESQFRAFFENSSDFMCIRDMDGIITYANTIMWKSLGFKTSDELIGKHFKTIVDDETHKLLINLSKNELAKTGGVSGEAVMIATDDNKILGEFSGSALYDKNGEITSICCVIRDVTEKKQMIEEIRSSEKKFRTYVNSSPDSLFIIDKMGNFIEANPAATKVTGYSQDELINMTIADLAHPSVRNQIPSGNLTGTTSHMKIFCQKKDGSDLYLQMSTTKISSDRFAAYCKEITQEDANEKHRNNKT